MIRRSYGLQLISPTYERPYKRKNDNEDGVTANG